MNDEELKALFRRNDTLAFYYAIVLFAFICITGFIVETELGKAQSILCEQHQVESCKP